MRSRPQHLPAALGVALDHVLWLRMADPDLTPEQAGNIIGSYACYNWAQVIEAYARAWEALPEAVRREGSQ